MAGSTGVEEDLERAARWKRLGELGIEKALRESGLASTSISAVLRLVEPAGGEITGELLSRAAEKLDLHDGKCILLAALGRGRSPLNSLALEKKPNEDLLNGDEAFALCVNLRSNPNIESLSLRGHDVFGTPRGCTLLGDALSTNAALKRLHLTKTNMESEAVKCLMDGIKANTALWQLDLSLNPLCDKGIGYVAQMLTTNTTITWLNLFCTQCSIKGAKQMSSALERNTCLLNFNLGGNQLMGRAGIATLLKKLIHDGDPADAKNATITRLHLDTHQDPENFSVESVASVIRTNKILSFLSIRDVRLEARDWLDQIFPALKENHTLKCLDIRDCGGLTEDVLHALMDVIKLSNTGLEDVLLHFNNENDMPGAALVYAELRERKFFRASSTGNTEEAAAKWRKLGEIGVEEALRESGASAASRSAVLGLVNAGDGEITSELLSAIAEELNVDHGKCLMLALLGRRRHPPIKSLKLERSSDEDALNGDETLAFCVNLNTNPNVRSITLRRQGVFATRRGCTLLGKSLSTNTAMKELFLPAINMGSESVKCLMDGIEANTTLYHLDLSDNPLYDKGIGYVAQMLKRNTTLKILNVFRTWCGLEGAEQMSSALERNTSLVELNLGDNNLMGKEGRATLLTTFSQVGDSAYAKNTTITKLHLGKQSREHCSAESVASMIRSNKTLSWLDLSWVHLESRVWVEQIISALKDNQTLKCLDLTGCRGLTKKRVSNALMDVLRFSSTGLEKIILEQTDMSIKAGVVNEELRVNREYRSRLRDQAQVKPKSGRLVLCGYEYAGKTSICETMRQIVDGTSRSDNQNITWKKFLKKYPNLRQFLFGKNVHKEFQERTRGFDIVVLTKEPLKTTIWDFAGQPEYYVLHDYIFPDVKNSCFLYVCSARFPPDDKNPRHRRVKDQQSMRDEFLFWMRFIASNSKPIHYGDGERRLPSVTFVLSSKDTLAAAQLTKLSQWAQDIVSDFKRDFHDVIALSDNVEIVDAHSFEDVERLLNTVKRRLVKILEQPTEYAICQEVRHTLESWETENPSMPLMTLGQFKTMCETHLQESLSSDLYRTAQLNSPVGRETVLAYLNDVGEIISLKGLDFIVINPRWFGVGVLGSLINAFSGQALSLHQTWNGVCGCFKPMETDMWKVVHNHGFVTKERIGDLLKKSLQTMRLEQSISSDKLIDLMLHLEMCFKEHPENVDSLLYIPAFFDNMIDDAAAKGLRKLGWKLQRPRDELFHFMGRRLECENQSLTFLTPGFFPRLQVVLVNFLREQLWTQHKGFEVARNLIFFTDNGIEVFVEYSGDIGFFVDILVKSSRPCGETLEFINKNVKKKILEFCASPQGCQGVLLAESVIRPVCVRELHLCASRKPHAILVSSLKHGMEGGHGESYKHTWSQNIKTESDMDFALDLLEGEGSYARWIAAHQAEGHQAEGVSSSSGTSSSTSIDQLPKLFYPTIDDISTIRNLEADMNISTVMPIKIHLMCDWRGGPHVVKDQAGRTMKLRTSGEQNWPIMKYAIALLWAGVKIDARTANVHAPAEVALIDNWIQEMFSTPQMPIDFERLRLMMDHGTTPGAVSNQDIFNWWKSYMTVDSSIQWLKPFLNLQDIDGFFKDFQLRQVIYKYSSHIGWLCHEHFVSQYDQDEVTFDIKMI